MSWAEQFQPIHELITQINLKEFDNMKTVQKVFLGVAALCVFALILISLSVLSDAKTFDHEQLENLKTHLE